MNKFLALFFIYISITSCSFVTNSKSDKTPPTISFTNLKENEIISNLFTVCAQASDKNKIIQISLFIDSTKISTSDSSYFETTLNCNNFTYGIHFFKAQAEDNYKNIGETPEIPVYICVQDTIKPSISFENISPNDTFEGEFCINAVANDDIGISKIKIYFDEQKIAENNSSSIKINVNSNDYQDGIHTLKASALDLYGNSNSTNILNIHTLYDFAQNSNGKISVAIINYKELTEIDSTGFGDPYFVYKLTINNETFATYTSNIFYDTPEINTPITHIFDIPDNTREYKLTIRVYDKNEPEDRSIDYTPAPGYIYLWINHPLTDTLSVQNFNGTEDNIPNERDCQISTEIKTIF